jgi:hypothetical protein
MSSGVGGKQYYDDDTDTGVSAGCSANAHEYTNKTNDKNNSKTYYDDDYYKYKTSNENTYDLMKCGNQASSCDQWWGGMQVSWNTSYFSV